MDLSLFFLGTAGSVPSARRGLPAVLLSRGGERLLFDCGEGTQRQMLRSVGLVDLDCVLISHFHADHWLGLPGMLKSFALRERSKPLTVYGPVGLQELMGAMRVVYGRRLPYELTFLELEPWEEIERDGYRIAAVPVNHGNRVAHGYALLEDERPGEFDRLTAESLGVPAGPAFGALQRGEIVGTVRPEQVMGPAREGRRIVISGDTAPFQALAIAAHRADVLVHEATFAEDERERARETMHSTARQAAELALEAEVKLLVLTHVSNRYSGGELREEARAVFPATELPRDFDSIEVPFPERAGARLVRWSERQASERGEAAGEQEPDVEPGSGPDAASEATAQAHPDGHTLKGTPSRAHPDGRKQPEKQPIASP
ncbi:MAG TPA: ribonuclease Z [Solirubrobacteraceae bacterium]|nr:ribonuclease Z [Solirubrobacteraceae bacterium]